MGRVGSVDLGWGRDGEWMPGEIKTHHHLDLLSTKRECGKKIMERKSQFPQ